MTRLDSVRRVREGHSEWFIQRDDYSLPLPEGQAGVKGTVTTNFTVDGIRVVTSDMSPKTQRDNLPVKTNR